MLALLSGPVVQYARACESGNCYIVPLIYVITWLGRALEHTRGDWGKINNLMDSSVFVDERLLERSQHVEQDGQQYIVHRVRQGHPFCN